MQSTLGMAVLRFPKLTTAQSHQSREARTGCNCWLWEYSIHSHIPEKLEMPAITGRVALGWFYLLMNPMEQGPHVGHVKWGNWGLLSNSKGQDEGWSQDRLQLSPSGAGTFCLPCGAGPRGIRAKQTNNSLIIRERNRHLHCFLVIWRSLNHLNPNGGYLLNPN